jgi:hypothetical protein
MRLFASDARQPAKHLSPKLGISEFKALWLHISSLRLPFGVKLLLELIDLAAKISHCSIDFPSFLRIAASNAEASRLSFRGASGVTLFRLRLFLKAL